MVSELLRLGIEPRRLVEGAARAAQREIDERAPLAGVAGKEER